MTVADALHRAAEAIRALPDRDLLELALRATRESDGGWVVSSGPWMIDGVETVAGQKWPATPPTDAPRQPFSAKCGQILSFLDRGVTATFGGGTCGAVEPDRTPTAALRQEVATSTPRPTGRGSARAAEAADKRQQVLDLLRNGPLPRAEIASRLGLTESSTHRALTALVDSGQIVRPPLRGDRWRIR